MVTKETKNINNDPINQPTNQVVAGRWKKKQQLLQQQKDEPSVCLR
jgi:hypothetical protein